MVIAFLYINYGGGREYPDISTSPHYNSDELTWVFAYQEPIGNVAVSKDTTDAPRLFFTIHPESRPKENKLMEIVGNKAIPYPNTTYQQKFNTILGVYTDLQNRLWVIDHGNHSFDPVILTAFDLTTNKVINEYAFPKNIAKKFSFFNDISVSPDGKYVAISNISFFGKKPGIVIYNIEKKISKTQLEEHPSVTHEKYVPVTPIKKMRFFGIVDLLIGIDGIDFSRDGKYLYYAGMGHSGLFRIPTRIITDFSKTKTEITQAIEFVAKKPLSDGIRTDTNGNTYITDIEHQGIYVVTPDKKGFTLIKDKRIQWADGLTLSSSGVFYLADSNIPNQMLKSKDHIAEHAPYNIYKFNALPKE